MKTPLGELGDFALAPLKVRNRFWDSIFYDVGCLTLDDQKDLAPLTFQEGDIIVVPPSGAGRIRHYRHTFRFMNKQGQDIRAIVLAGVGSSVLGTAALARNVADTYNYDVAGIVTGYGGSDLLTEALGGWFVFGALERAGLRTTLLDKEDVGTGISDVNGQNDRIAKTPDVATLVDILLADPPKLELLVGHSKGSLLIDFVLEWFLDELQGDPQDRYDHLFDRLNIVTLGAVVSLPERFKNVRQFMGELDDFGGANSHQGVSFQEVPGAWHHLNPKLPPYIWRHLKQQWPLPSYDHVDVSKVLHSKPGDFREKPVRGNFALTRS